MSLMAATQRRSRVSPAWVQSQAAGRSRQAVDKQRDDRPGEAEIGIVVGRLRRGWFRQGSKIPGFSVEPGILLIFPGYPLFRRENGKPNQALESEFR
jgi:hypothetical protein